MWEVGDLMHQWEELQTSAEDQPAGVPPPLTQELTRH